MTPSPFMQRALELARVAATQGEVPIGAVVVHQGRIIAGAHNLTETTNDPTAHAELLAVRSACALLATPRLPDCDLYVTLEPCPMCATAISFARIRRLYYGAYDMKGGGVENGPRVFGHATCHHRPEVYGGMQEGECGKVLREFFHRKR